MTHAISLDVGGQSVKSARVTEQLAVLDERNHPIDSLADAEALLATMAGIIASHLAAGEPRGVALAFPGPFDYPGGVCLIRHTSHGGGVKFGGLYRVNVREALRARLRRPTLPIVFRNDAEAAILGEAVHGAGRPYRRVIGITLGTGLGSAFVVGGRAQVSGPGVPENGWLYCVPFAAATADDAFSTRGLLARLDAAGLAYDDVHAATVDAATVDAATVDAGQTAELKRAFEEFGADLGIFLRPFAADFDADAVIVLGGIANAWSLFAPALQAQLPVPAIRGALGASAALIGAAELLTG
jgi:glucokinase